MHMAKHQSETRQKFDLYEVPVFEKKWKRYDAAEVDTYLSMLVDAYNEMYLEYEALKATVDEYLRVKEKLADMQIADMLVGEAPCLPVTSETTQTEDELEDDAA